MKKIFAVLAVAALASCGESTTTITERTDSTVTESKAETPVTQVPAETPPQTTPASDDCYVYILQRDTMVLHLQTNGDMVSGKLSFDNYQKDGSSGPVQGTKNGDIIKLLYTFNSEGMTSVSEEYFKISGNDLLLGIGEPAMKGDTSYFPDPNKIKYTGGRFVKTDCNSIASKYKY